jgi:hypothetical protein
LIQIEFFENCFMSGGPLTVRTVSSASIRRCIKARFGEHREGNAAGLTGD